MKKIYLYRIALRREIEWVPIRVKPPTEGWYLGWLKKQKVLSVMTINWNGREWNYRRHLTHWSELPKGPE